MGRYDFVSDGFLSGDFLITTMREFFLVLENLLACRQSPNILVNSFDRTGQALLKILAFIPYYIH